MRKDDKYIGDEDDVDTIIALSQLEEEPTRRIRQRILLSTLGIDPTLSRIYAVHSGTETRQSFQRTGN